MGNKTRIRGKLEGLPPACYDPYCRNSQAIGEVEAGVGCYPQQAVDLAHSELFILRKASDCDKKFLIYVDVHIKIRIKNVHRDWDET